MDRQVIPRSSGTVDYSLVSYLITAFSTGCRVIVNTVSCQKSCHIRAWNGDLVVVLLARTFTTERARVVEDNFMCCSGMFQVSTHLSR